MKILAIDTATQVASVALLTDKRLVAENTLDYKLKHSKTLIHSLDEIIKNTEQEYSDLDYIAVATGPGSFTGLRIGIATAKAIAQAAGLPVIPVSTLEALAYNIAYSSGVVCPLLDARRSQVYSALFKTDGTGRVERICPDQAVSLKDLEIKISQLNDQVYLLGDGSEMFQNELSLRKETTLISPYLRLSSAGSVAACAANHLAEQRTYKTLEPSYLRPSYAEEKNKVT